MSFFIVASVFAQDKGKSKREEFHLGNKKIGEECYAASINGLEVRGVKYSFAAQ